MIVYAFYYTVDENSKDSWITSQKIPRIKIGGRNKLKEMSLNGIRLRKIGWENRLGEIS